MDSMEIRSNLLRRIISGKINKILEKKLGVDPEILLDYFECSGDINKGTGEDRTVITLTISLPTPKFGCVLQEVIK